jgi:hypothetical protein
MASGARHVPRATGNVQADVAIHRDVKTGWREVKTGASSVYVVERILATSGDKSQLIRGLPSGVDERLSG